MYLLVMQIMSDVLVNLIALFRYSRKKRQSRARSRSLELHWPTNPCHPSMQLFDKERTLSPLSMLIASECFQTSGTRPVSCRPKQMRTDLKETSFIKYIGQERLAGRQLIRIFSLSEFVVFIHFVYHCSYILMLGVLLFLVSCAVH